jgi:hypothetical protein
MRYYEICSEQEAAAQSLRQLNRQKQHARRILDGDAERAGLVLAMYGNTRRRLDWIELEKAEIELAQQHVELATAKAEAEAAGADELHDMAVAAMKQTARNKQAVERAADTERKRRQAELLKR